MKIHFQPPPPPPPPPVPPKELPTQFQVEQATKELIEKAQKDRDQRAKRRRMFGDRKNPQPENSPGSKPATPQDQSYDILA